MDNERKTISLGYFPCPNCSELASSFYTKRELKKALEVGELPVSHYKCDHHWKLKLEPQLKTRIKEALDREFS